MDQLPTTNSQRPKRAIAVLGCVFASVALAAQQSGLDPATIRKPLADSWPVYSGDYTGRRYSALRHINQKTVKNLSLAWVASLTAGSGAGLSGRGGGGGALGGPPMIVGGEGTGEFATGGAPTVKGSILMVNGVLYVTAPDNVWALDAHDGHLIWHYYWKTRGGTHIGNRGAALWHDYLFFETPDNYLVSLDARTGKERWHVEIADFEQQYFSTAAPVVVDNHVLVGTGNDLDAPGFLQSFDPETGKTIWIQEPPAGRDGLRGDSTRGVAYWRDAADERIMAADDPATIATWQPVAAEPLHRVPGGWDGPVGTGTVFVASEYDPQWTMGGTPPDPAFGWAMRFPVSGETARVRHGGDLPGRIQLVLLVVASAEAPEDVHGPMLPHPTSYSR